MTNKIIVLLIIFIFLNCTAYCNEVNYGAEIIKKVLKKNEDLNDFYVKFNSKVYFMYMEMPLTGEIYFKSPDNFKLNFTNIPNVLKSQKSNFDDIVPGSEKYNPNLCRFIRTDIKGAKKLSLIEVKPEKKQNLQKTFLWINNETLNPDYVVLKYRKGQIEIENEFRLRSNFVLPQSQKVEFKLPEFRGKATIKYYGYKVNKGLDESLFK